MPSSRDGTGSASDTSRLEADSIRLVSLECSNTANTPPDGEGEGEYEISLNAGEVSVVIVPAVDKDYTPAYQVLEVQLKHSIDQWRFLGFDDYLHAVDRWKESNPTFRRSSHKVEKDGLTMPQPKEFYDPDGFRVRTTFAVTYTLAAEAKTDEAFIGSARDQARLVVWPYFRQLVLGLCQALNMGQFDVGIQFAAARVPMDFAFGSPAYNRYLADPSSVGPAPPKVSRYKRVRKKS